MEMLPYGGYLESEVLWVGAYPEHWNLTRVKYEAYVKARVGWHGLKSDDFTDEGPYLVTGSDFKGPQILWSDCYHCDIKRYEQDPYIQLKNGDLLLTKDGTIGKVALVEGLEDEEKATLNSGVFVVRPLFNNFSTKFYFWLLQSRVFKDFVDYNKTGSTIVHLYQDTFVNFSYASPRLDEQVQIANFLDHETAKIDTLIDKQQQLIKLLKEKRQAMISHAVTKGLNPDVPMKESGVEWLGEVPEHWVVSCVKHVVSRIVDGPHFSPKYVDDGYMFISARNIKVDKWSLSDAKFVSEKDFLDFNKRVKPEKGDVLLTKGGTTGVARAVDLDIPFQVWVHVAVLKTIKTKIDPFYFAYVLNGTSCYEQSQLSTYGATNNDLGLGRIAQIAFARPPLAEQEIIRKQLDYKCSKIDALVAKAERQVFLMQERRTALISAAVTGKIDVRNWQDPANQGVQHQEAG